MLRRMKYTHLKLWPCNKYDLFLDLFHMGLCCRVVILFSELCFPMMLTVIEYINWLHVYLNLSKNKPSILTKFSFYSILFYSILFYSILFYSILFYSILFYSILFYSILRRRLSICIGIQLRSWFTICSFGSYCRFAFSYLFFHLYIVLVVINSCYPDYSIQFLFNVANWQITFQRARILHLNFCLMSFPVHFVCFRFMACFGSTIIPLYYFKGFNSLKVEQLFNTSNLKTLKTLAIFTKENIIKLSKLHPAPWTSYFFFIPYLPKSLTTVC